MIRLGQNLGIKGIDTDYNPCIKDDQSTDAVKIEQAGFYNFPEDFSYSEDGTIGYSYIPWVLTDTPTFIGIKEFALQPNTSYTVSGYAGLKSNKVYISIKNQEIDDFTTFYDFVADVHNGYFNFDFSDTELLFQEKTTIYIWVESVDYYELKTFNAVLTTLESQIKIVFASATAVTKEEKSGTRLTVTGTHTSIGDFLSGVLIYDSTVLSEESLEKQQIIINGFTRLGAGETLTYEEEREFLNALSERSENTMSTPTDLTTYSLVLTQKIEEGDYQPTQVYVWSEVPKDQVTSSSAITISSNSWSKICLSGDTKILMLDGSTKRLDRLLPGEWVRARDGNITKVLEIKKEGMSPCHTLYFFEEEIVIDETSPHRFYNVEDGYWKYLSQWKEGEHGLTSENKQVALLEKKIVYQPIENYGLITEEGSYYANNLLSGLMKCNRDVISEKNTQKIIDIMNSVDFMRGLSAIKREVL